MGNYADIEAHVVATAVRSVDRATMLEYLAEFEGFVNFGGSKMGVNFPPLRTAQMRDEIAGRPIFASGGTFFQFPGTSFVTQIDSITIRGEKEPLFFVPYRDFVVREENSVNGSNIWTNGGQGGDGVFGGVNKFPSVNVITFSKKFVGAVPDLFYYTNISPLPDVSRNLSTWLWNLSKDTYMNFITARVLQQARNKEEAIMWFNECADRMVRLNRTYGESATQRAGIMRYQGIGQIGSRYPKYFR